MKHFISNNQLQASVQSKGTELCSLKSLNSGKEYMWNADPNYWASHAPVLFPAIGAFKNGECFINGKSYQIPKHGFIRHNEDIKLIEQTATSLLYELSYSENTLALYPYQFNFQIEFRLDANQLIVSHKVQNLDDKTIYFSLGAHPAFNCPLNEGESYSDYYIEFEHKETADRTLLSVDGLISDQTIPVLENSNQLGLHTELFNDDALILKTLQSRRVSLKSRKSSQILSVSYKDFNYLGIWAKPNAPFVCIEPWLGIADHENTNGDFLQKDGLIQLPKGEVFEARYSISIDE